VQQHTVAYTFDSSFDLPLACFC